MAERTIVLHYHLFKNAGTSLDRILQRNFADRWVTREFTRNGGDNSALVAEWVTQNPDAIAFSSHTMMGPLPKIEGVRVISVVFLRDPVARIVSAYRFERKQEADTLGAKLAKEHDLEGYVRIRLAIPGDRQCRNFQTHRLAAFLPGAGPELERAKKALDFLSLVGTVEDFSGSLARLETILKDSFPDFTAEAVHANVSEKSGAPLDEAVSSLLEQNNRADRQLIRYLLAHQS